MGLILLTLALGGTLLRPDSTEFVPLFAEQDLRGGNIRFFQAYPGHPFFMTPTDPAGYQFWGIDTTGQAAYLTTTDIAYQRMNVYQLRARHPRLIVENAYAGMVYAATNFSWMLYAIDDPNGGWEYWAMNLHTGKRLSVTALVQPRPIAFRQVHRFSDDGEWLYLVVQEPDPPRYEIVAVHLSNGAVVDVTNGKGEAAGVHLQGVVGNWVIFDRGGAMYRIHPDGSDFGPLAEPPINVAEDTTSFPAFVFLTYPAYNLALIHQNSRTLAVDVEAGKIRWQEENLNFWYAPDNPTGWVALVQDGVIIRLHLPTGEIQPMPEVISAPDAYRIGDATDGRWMLYAQPNANSGQWEWWQYTWATGQSRRIHLNVDTYDFRGLSPDGQWIWATNQQTFTLMRVRVSDGQPEVVLTERIYPPSLVGWMKPPVRAWHPLPLILMALALLIISVLPRPLLQLLHLYPSSLRGH